MNDYLDTIEQTDGITLLTSDEMRTISGGACAQLCSRGYFNCLRAIMDHDACWRSENFCLNECWVGMGPV